MSRLHQKCVIASAGTHVLLAVILFACPAFLTSKSRPSDVTPITFYPSILIEQPFDNPGDSPGSRPPAPTPAPPAPVVRPTPAPPAPPTREIVREVAPPKTTGESLEVAKEPKKKRLEISTTLVTKKPNTKPTPASETPTVDTKEQEQREWRQRAANQIGRTANNVKSGTGSATKIEEGTGSGTSGPSYASYAAWVWSVYESAWVRPEDASIPDATVEVSVTIASSGTVIAKRITKRSGDRAVDASVQSALDRITTVSRPFPEGAKDKQRTYIIPFNMKTSRGAA
jgi:TonB family protein